MHPRLHWHGTDHAVGKSGKGLGFLRNHHGIYFTLSKGPLQGKNVLEKEEYFKNRIMIENISTLQMKSEYK